MTSSAEEIDTSRRLEEPPEWELECLFDDIDEPSTVTVFYPTGEQTATEWLTIETTAAVPIDEIR